MSNQNSDVPALDAIDMFRAVERAVIERLRSGAEPVAWMAAQPKEPNVSAKFFMHHRDYVPQPPDHLTGGWYAVRWTPLYAAPAPVQGAVPDVDALALSICNTLFDMTAKREPHVPMGQFKAQLQCAIIDLLATQETSR